MALISDWQQEVQFHHKTKRPPQKKQVGKRFFAEFYDKTSYSSWKTISLNKHIPIINHVGLIETHKICHIVLKFK